MAKDLLLGIRFVEYQCLPFNLDRLVVVAEIATECQISTLVILWFKYNVLGVL
jgi:hypothetical protein